jgi:hypothetical protein
MFDFLRVLINFFEKYNIPYMLSGSMAMSTYVVPRFTRDFDFVVYLQPASVSRLAEYFKDGYYCDEDAIRDSILHRSMFNIIDHRSNYKADFVILKNEPFRQAEFERKRKTELNGIELYIVSPEDLLLSKLIWIQDFQSAIQIEDILQLKRLPGLDFGYMNKWIKELKLNTFDLLNNE